MTGCLRQQEGTIKTGADHGPDKATTTHFPFPILIGDIGGTNARFSILIDESGERISFP